ncbi:hypothetical protein OSSY52_07740 [Tepiditoga spiralis]|uniref:Uncharacterized protein n=1 Tax=Tepiditoga spiralis TaxID=2108365 RepID=A0A7G1G6Z0_9BACT|nr:hypothetical protein [Tepiditoga spiralis]BBE30633.1 hypothetical protein OSSY52_07740 [Tepiditoga spiralis]
MVFKGILFTPKDEFYSFKNFFHKNDDTIIIKDIEPEKLELTTSSGFVSYFLVEEFERVYGIKRYLKPDYRMKKYLKTMYVDYISDEIRELYGDYIEVISKYMGLGVVIESLNELIKTQDVISNYEFWIDDLAKNVEGKYREAVSQKITKFANIYLIKVYEKLFQKNIELLSIHSSEITYKILETSLIQKTF